jgi:hypothetical protein
MKGHEGTRRDISGRLRSTDADGKFDLGTVKRGEYRLLLSPHRGFKQPEKLGLFDEQLYIGRRPDRQPYGSVGKLLPDSQNDSQLNCRNIAITQAIHTEAANE